MYALRSTKDEFLYIGMSEDPQKRLKHHNLGMTQSTKNRRPFELIFTEQVKDREKAREREKYYKSGCGRELIKEKIRNMKLA